MCWVMCRAGHRTAYSDRCLLDFSDPVAARNGLDQWLVLLGGLLLRTVYPTDAVAKPNFNTGNNSQTPIVNGAIRYC